MKLLAALSLVAAGFVNLVAGLLGLIGGFAEAGLAEARPEGGAPIGIAELIATPYGRYALAHLSGGLLQLVAASSLSWLARWPLLPVLALLSLSSGLLEVWGFFFKGSLTLLAAPGIAAALLTAALFVRQLRE